MVDQREELPLLPFGYPIGNVSAASHRISLIIRFHFVSFVLFVVIFLYRYNPLTLCENILYRMPHFLRSRPPSAANVCALAMTILFLTRARVDSSYIEHGV